MELLNTFIEKLATLKGSLPTFEKPKGKLTDPNTHEYHLAQIFENTAHNHVKMPFVIDKASGAYVWDVTGKKYIDYMASYGCANLGHNHPKVLDALVGQAKKLAVTSIVCPHSQLGPVSKRLTEKLGYDKILFMNSGAEAVDTAVLTARKWGYQKKKVAEGKATVIFPRGCYWGMIMSSRSGTDWEMLRNGVGPLATEALHFDFVNYNDADDLEAKFKANPNICAYIFEPIQGYAGNIHPSPGYYIRVRELCKQYKVLMICDEIQAGLGRTGKLFTCLWEGVRPDIITMGKSLGGDYMPISAMLADDEIMNVWLPGTHMSTYAANSLACAVALTTVEVLFEENLIERAHELGKILEEEFVSYNYPFIQNKYCGKGLFASLEFKDSTSCLTVCKHLLENGVFVVPEQKFLKIMPPLCISEQDFRDSLKILREGLEKYNKIGKIGLLT